MNPEVGANNINAFRTVMPECIRWQRERTSESRASVRAIFARALISRFVIAFGSVFKNAFVAMKIHSRSLPLYKLKNSRAFTHVPGDISFTRHFFSGSRAIFLNRPAQVFSEMRFRVIITSRNGPLNPRAFPSAIQSPLPRSLWCALSS